MKELPELRDFEQLRIYASPLVRFRTIGSIEAGGTRYPVESLCIGPDDPSLPVLGLFGGVHGLERIGSQVLLYFFQSFLSSLSWDADLQRMMSEVRIVSIPVINPGGMARLSRSNPRNVDLMRNAPIEAEERTHALVSGHRLSPMLPWYRGEVGVLEKENELLFQFVQEEMFSSRFSIALDVHSGFGLRDRLWYPYAKTSNPFPRLREAMELKALLDRTHPCHVYLFEGQSSSYLTHGDVWDYLFGLHRSQHSSVFLPLTLEMGSWSWVRKNPLQLFTKLGLFHPVKRHRHARVIRRHRPLLEFLLKAVKNHENWRHGGQE